MTHLDRRTAGRTFADDLAKGCLSPGRSLLDLADGDLPPSLHDSAVRWRWAADLLTDPAWGMAALTPQHRPVFSDAAALCIRTFDITASHTVDELPFARWAALSADWRTSDAAVSAALTTSGPGDGGWETLDVVIELVTDALDLLAGHDITGSQMITAAFTAHIKLRGTHDARNAMTAALTHADTLARSADSAAPHLRAVS